MSSFGGFGGFGQTNSNQQQSAPFGGFGQPANTSTGFGSTTNSAFGSNSNAGGSLFGGTSSGFGSSGGFGPTQNSGFGAKPAFGAPATSTGGGLFGSTTTTNTGSGFGGFGSANNTTSSPFNSTNTGGGLFGSTAKPAFGATNAATTPFGGGASTGFVSTTSAFGGTGTALGGPVGECQGTGAVPFTPYIEKEPNSTTNQQNAFQSIVFLPPYQKFSPEELRLADYAQGRRYGNASGQAGAFGANTSFGGFGANNANTGFNTTSSTGGGLFGSTSNATPFGTQTTNTGFGSNTNTAGGLFGTAKPATTGGGLFGSTTATTGTSLFGSGTGNTGFGNNSNTSTGFGASNTAGSSLFSGNQNKSPFSFGTQQPSTTGTGFGTSTTGGFGNTGSSLFGSAQTQSTPPAFGASNTTNSNPFGSFGSNATAQQTGTSSLFSNNTAKPATSLFGATNPTNTSGAGTSLFGSNTNTASNPFGGNTNQNQGTSLFGAKPATTSLGGGSLFGSNNANNPTSNTGSLFGSFGQNQNSQSQQPQNAGSSLFGGANNLTNKPSLFGTQPSTGGSLFGGNNPNQGGSSLFGSLNTNPTQQPQQSSLFGSSFGGSQQNAAAQPQSLTASISDPTAFGTSMFANLASPQIHNPGPLATPLSSLSKQKKSGVLPMHKMNPGSLSRYSTPQKRGFGFSYSTYGTPGSASSTTSTPITFGNTMLGNSLNRGLTKSVSTSSLRGSYTSSFNREDSILAPGAFSASPSSRFNSTGSMKKLVINRSIRTDLFSPPPKDSSSTPSQGGILKKRVSFDSSTVGGNSNGAQNGNQNGFSSPLKQVQSSSATPSSEEMGYLRSSGQNGGSNGSKTNGIDSEPEMEQVKGNELAIVPEEEAPAPAPQKARPRVISQEDQEPGRYWMMPAKEEIMDMNRSQRQKVTGFTVGREGVGQVAFDVPVDLTNIDLDSVFDKIVILNVRQATVYPDQSKKPPMGKGLNVPATIQLQNSWPRGKDKRNPSHEKSGPRFQKHIERLAKVPNTQFKDYNKETGVWTFTVEHFTTYGLEYEDDETDGEGMSEFGQSTLSAPPDTPTPPSRAPKVSADASFNSSEMSGITESDPDDTFDFKKKKILPGAFDDQDVFEDDAEIQDGEQDSQSFLDERSAGSQSENGVEEPVDHDDNFQSQELVTIEDQEMAGSYPLLDDTAEHNDEDSQEDDTKHNVEDTPGAIMRARMRAMRTTGSPLKRKLKLDDDDWTDMLRRTLSPQKQDRERLKRMRDYIKDDAYMGDKENKLTLAKAAQGRVVSDGRGFATSIDLMHSLFGEAKSPVKVLKAPAKGKGFEWPYAKQPKTSDLSELTIDENERMFHESLKPSWDANGTIVYAAPPNRNAPSRNSRQLLERNGLLIVQKGGVVSEYRDIKFARLSSETSVDALKKQKSITSITSRKETPYARLATQFKFADIFDDRNAQDPASVHEKLVWELAGVLFDDIEIPKDLENVEGASNLLRKDNFSAFWQKLVGQATDRYVAMAKSSEEKAIACLSGHRIADACGHLLNGKDFHLATLVALMGGDEMMKKSIREQLLEWQKSKVLSEFSQPIRAIYELLSGNVCVCDGSKGAPVEDRIESFIISKRFGLDWRQSFGLRFWYAILLCDDLARAVQIFADDLKQDKETSRPCAWYVEQGIPSLWDDSARNTREDLLWGLLKLYANPNADLESILRPENSQLSPLDVRLSWQLSNALIASKNASYSEGDEDRADQLTFSLAAQLTNEGNWIDAVFVLLHLSSDSVRAKSIQDHLAHYAGRIGAEDGAAFNTLTQDLNIPAKWIWEAKALYMRSVLKDPKREVECLLRAGLYDEAHKTFSKEVAPKTVIEQDWDNLRSLLAGFNGREASITKWHLGGELYADYLNLMDSQKKGLGKVDDMLVERLLAALPAMVEDGRHASFLETVAVQEISGVVAKLVIDRGRQGHNKDFSRVLRLPLTEDKCLKHTIDMSLSFYRNLMAGAR